MFLVGDGQEFLAKAEHAVAETGADAPESLSSDLFEVIGVVRLDELTSQYETKAEVDRKDAGTLASAKEYADAHLEAAKAYADNLKTSALDQASSAAEGIAAAKDRVLSGELVSHFLESQPGLEILKKVYSSDEEMSNETGTTQFHSLKGWSYVVSGASGNDLYVTLAEGSKPMLIGPETAAGLIQKYATKDEVHAEVAAQVASEHSFWSDYAKSKCVRISENVHGNPTIRTTWNGDTPITSGLLYKGYDENKAYGYDYYLANETVTQEKFTGEYGNFMPLSSLSLVGGCTKKEFRELSGSVVYKTEFDSLANNVYLISQIDSLISSINDNIAATNEAIEPTVNTKVNTAVQGLSQQVARDYATKAYADEIETSIRYAVVDTGSTFGAGSYTDIDNLQGSNISVYGGLWESPIAGTELPNVIIYSSSAANASTSSFKDLSVPKLTVSKAREVEVWFGYQQTVALSGKKPAAAISSPNAGVYLDNGLFTNVTMSVDAGSYVYYKFNVKFFGGKQFWTLIGVLVNGSKLTF